jgi:hypothetical protein
MQQDPQYVYKRSAPDDLIPVPISPEGVEFLIQAHEKSCGVHSAQSLFCPCDKLGLTAAAYCEGCGDVVVMLVRGDSWCPCAQALWAKAHIPFLRWWA